MIYKSLFNPFNSPFMNDLYNNYSEFGSPPAPPGSSFIVTEGSNDFIWTEGFDSQFVTEG